MDLLLSKVLPIFIYPLGLSLAVMLVALLLLLFRHRVLGGFLLLLAMGYLWLASTPRIATQLYAQLEQQYGATPAEYARTTDVIIVLGGIVGQPLPPRVAPELHDAIDRVVAASRLYRAQKASTIIVAAGNLPWLDTEQAEAVLIRSLLVEWGVDYDHILLDMESRNTFENAVNSKRLMSEFGLESAMLVTSASHMPRAVGVFRKAGINVIPFPVDIAIVNTTGSGLFDWLPSVDALNMTTTAIHEWLGIFYYRWRGWL